MGQVYSKLPTPKSPLIVLSRNCLLSINLSSLNLERPLFFALDRYLSARYGLSQLTLSSILWSLWFPEDFEQAKRLRSLLLVVVFQQYLNGWLPRSGPPTLMEGVQNERVHRKLPLWWNQLHRQRRTVETGQLSLQELPKDVWRPIFVQCVCVWGQRADQGNSQGVSAFGGQW